MLVNQGTDQSPAPGFCLDLLAGTSQLSTSCVPA
jgi:hypothetical protein